MTIHLALHDKYLPRETLRVKRVRYLEQNAAELPQVQQGPRKDGRAEQRASGRRQSFCSISVAACTLPPLTLAYIFYQIL
jgi:hypothetical protein